ncbi:MAG: acyl-CoA dehydrogenase family protein [Vampirovibrionales bacterium]|nr:acyl-CoA dehydrogenase family protein [Vampirovibrionales bacterium]
MLGSHHCVLKSSTSALAEKVIRPRLQLIESGDRAAFEAVWQALAHADLCRLTVPVADGGLGEGSLSNAVVMEALAAVNASVATALSVHNTVGILPIILAGTVQQKAQYLAALANGEKIAAFGLTEPGAGSDAAGSCLTTATPLDYTENNNAAQFELNGAKVFITNAQTAQIFVVTAKTAPGKLTAFIIERDTPGFKVLPGDAKLGLRGSDWGELQFERCIVSASQQLGAINQGFKLFLACLDAGRISIAAISVGIIQACLDECLRYIGENPSQRQTSAFEAYFAQTATRLEAARLLVYHAAALKDAGVPFALAAAQAKLFASEAAVEAASGALNRVGLAAYRSEFALAPHCNTTPGYALERLLRDAKAMTIVEGTSQVQRLVIGRQL